MTTKIEDRCRLVLVTPQEVSAETCAERLAAAFEGGDIASVIVPSWGMDDDAYQAHLKRMVDIGQSHGAAVIAFGDTRIAGRCLVDGIHATGGLTEVREILKEFGHKWIVGCSGGDSRDTALNLGELNPDYVFFGKFGQDTHEAPHKRNVELAQWWAGVVEVPCIVMGGNDLATLDASASTGADFVALSRAVLGDGVDSAAAVRQANDILSNHVFSEPE